MLYRATWTEEPSRHSTENEARHQHVLVCRWLLGCGRSLLQVMWSVTTRHSQWLDLYTYRPVAPTSWRVNYTGSHADRIVNSQSERTLSTYLSEWISYSWASVGCCTRTTCGPIAHDDHDALWPHICRNSCTVMLSVCLSVCLFNGVARNCDYTRTVYFNPT